MSWSRAAVPQSWVRFAATVKQRKLKNVRHFNIFSSHLSHVFITFFFKVSFITFSSKSVLSYFHRSQIDMLVPIWWYQILMHICTGGCTFETTIPLSHLNSNLPPFQLHLYIVGHDPSNSDQIFKCLNTYFSTLYCAITLSYFFVLHSRSAFHILHPYFAYECFPPIYWYIDAHLAPDPRFRSFKISISQQPGKNILSPKI